MQCFIFFLFSSPYLLISTSFVITSLIAEFCSLFSFLVVFHFILFDFFIFIFALLPHLDNFHKTSSLLLLDLPEAKSAAFFHKAYNSTTLTTAATSSRHLSLLWLEKNVVYSPGWMGLAGIKCSKSVRGFEHSMSSIIETVMGKGGLKNGRLHRLVFFLYFLSCFFPCFYFSSSISLFNIQSSPPCLFHYASVVEWWWIT